MPPRSAELGTFLLLLISAIVLTFTASYTSSQSPSNHADGGVDHASFLLSQLTLDEKLSLVHGEYGFYAGSSAAVPRLSIPALQLHDGPQGVGDHFPAVTQFPCALALVSTFDVNLMAAFAKSVAREMATRGVNVAEAPMINLARVAVGGRNFESMGEDPYLASKMTTASIKGFQRLNQNHDDASPMIANVKHFLLNNQEYNRSTVSVSVDERVLRELYLPAWEAAVRAGVGSIMCSYNRINNVHACEHPLINSFLKQELGFKGWVLSDWGATHSTVKAALAGLDQQMPDGSFFGASLKQAVLNGSVPIDRLNDMVTRILTAMTEAGLLDDASGEHVGVEDEARRIFVNASSPEHVMVARRFAEASTVLMKNSANLLPLDNTQVRSIAVIGDEDSTSGGGSGHVLPTFVITPYDGIRHRIDQRPVLSSSCTYEIDVDYDQPPDMAARAGDANECCSVCAAIDTCKFFSFDSTNTSVAATNCLLRSTTNNRISRVGVTSGACYNFSRASSVTYTNGSNIDVAVANAKAAQVAVVVVAVMSKEGADRPDLSLGSNSDALISAVLAAQPSTIVVLRSPGAVLMPWLSSSTTLIQQWYAGQEAGHALAAVLFGDVNPAARLPVTFPNAWSEQWLTSDAQYPGINDETVYSEGMLIGYRWYDAHSLTPMFSFGHGLSYTSFEYGNAVASTQADGTVTIQVSVTNTGKRPGAEVVQLYLVYPSAANEEVVKALRGFEKVHIFTGETLKVTFQVTVRDTSIWNVNAHAWQQVKGTWKAVIGASSTDLRATTSFTL